MSNVYELVTQHFKLVSQENHLRDLTRRHTPPYTEGELWLQNRFREVSDERRLVEDRLNSYGVQVPS